MPAAVVFILFYLSDYCDSGRWRLRSYRSFQELLIHPLQQVGQFVIRSMLRGIDSFPLLAVPMFVLSGMIMARGGISKKLFDVFRFSWKTDSRSAMCSNCNLSVLWSNLRIWTCNLQQSEV